VVGDGIVESVRDGRGKEKTYLPRLIFSEVVFESKLSHIPYDTLLQPLEAIPSPRRKGAREDVPRFPPDLDLRNERQQRRRHHPTRLDRKRRIELVERLVELLNRRSLRVEDIRPKHPSQRSPEEDDPNPLAQIDRRLSSWRTVDLGGEFVEFGANVGDEALKRGGEFGFAHSFGVDREETAFEETNVFPERGAEDATLHLATDGVL
jgi:hypothetical protein